MRRSLLVFVVLTVGLVVPAAAAQAMTPSGFRVAPSANLGDAWGAWFTGVTTPSPSSGWIIGTIYRHSHRDGTHPWVLMEQRDGRSWSRIGLPSLPPTADSTHLESISSTTPTDVWAVGYSTTPKTRPDSPSHHQLVYRRTAAGWQRVTIRTTDSSDVFNDVTWVSVGSPTNVWAIAFDQHRCAEDVLHYDGAHWSVADSENACAQTGPALGYFRVTAVGPSTAWGTGGACDYPAGTTGCGGLATCFGSACPAGSQLTAAGTGGFAVAGTASDLWAFSYANYTPSAEHWDGSGWQDDTPPFNGIGLFMRSGVVLPNGDLWIAGNRNQTASGGNTRTMILHHTASGWESLGSPNPAGADLLYAISHVGGTATEMWAVGRAGNLSNDDQPLLLHYS